MIYETLHILREQVNNYLKIFDTNNSLVLGNVAMLESSADDPNSQQMTNTNILSLLNIEEETTLKNKGNRTIKNGEVYYKNDPVPLNLYLLFSCNRNTYEFSLQSLSKIIEFFQGKKVFTHTNTVFTKSTSALSDVKEFKFIVDLYTPTFEEMNYVWGTLGGRQLPSALYKVTLSHIEREAYSGRGNLITEINGTLNTN